jgi:RNA polymerase sigma-70 factor (ECF subfamily)
MNTEKIWTEFSLALKKFIFSKVKNKAVTDDILQEVFIKIHLHKNELQKKEQLKSWLFSIANNSTQDYFRKKELVLPNKPEENTQEETSKDTHNPSDCLIPLILALPKKYKEALLLSEIKGIKQQAVAEQLGISLSAAKSRIQRGRDLLKKGFVNCCDYQLDEKGFLKGENKNVEDCKVCN